MTERELIERIKQSDEAAFNELVNVYQDKVFKIAYGYLKDMDDADDVTQEVFISVFENISSFRGDSGIMTWIFRITVNKSLNVLRKNKWKVFFRSIDNEDNALKMNYFDAMKDNFTPIDLMHQDEQTKALDRAIKDLPANQQTAFILQKYEDLSYNEIADIMQTTVSSVESLIHRAKINLQKKLFYYKVK